MAEPVTRIAAPHFSDRLAEAILARRSVVCAGLDPDLGLMPPAFVAERAAATGDPVEAAAACCADYCIDIIEAVEEAAAAVKPQAAFFEQYGAAGWAALGRVVDAARRRGIIVVLDVKRGDISSTARAYAAAAFGGAPLPGGAAAPGIGADAVTLSPYLGGDSVTPFLEHAPRGKGVFVLTRTSNPGAADLQEIEAGGRPVYLRVAELANAWGEGLTGTMGYCDLGVVAGATAPEALAAVRKRLPHAFILVPGIGAQGGQVEALREATSGDCAGLLVNASRSIMYAWRDDGGDHRRAAAAAADDLRKRIGKVLTI